MNRHRTNDGSRTLLPPGSAGFLLGGVVAALAVAVLWPSQPAERAAPPAAATAPPATQAAGPWAFPPVQPAEPTPVPEDADAPPPTPSADPARSNPDEPALAETQDWIATKLEAAGQRVTWSECSVHLSNSRAGSGRSGLPLQALDSAQTRAVGARPDTDGARVDLVLRFRAWESPEIVEQGVIVGGGRIGGREVTLSAESQEAGDDLRNAFLHVARLCGAQSAR